MKKIILMVVLTIVALCAPPPPQAHADPITLIIKEAVKKVLKAMDLAIQRIQNETIRLQNIQRSAENLMNKLKLNEIFEWSEKQRALFAGYYEELWKVKTAITYYQRVRDVVTLQAKLIKEYQLAISHITKHQSFKPAEIDFMLQVYTGILNQSVQNVEQISIIINSFKTQMSDAKRLELIQATAARIQTNLNELRSFNSQNLTLAISRMKNDAEIQTLKNLFDLP